MSRKNIESAIQLDTTVPPCGGFVVNKKESYATVTVCLEETEFLLNSAEYRRSLEGKKRFYYWDHFTDEYVIGGRYEFRVEITNTPSNRLEVRIHYVPFREDEFGVYRREKERSIILRQYEQTRVLKQLNSQCKDAFGKTCEEYLAEAAARLIQYLEENKS